MTRKIRMLTIDEAKRFAVEQGLNPGKIRGTNDLEFTRSSNPKVDILEWPEFEKLIVKKRLSIQESGGFLRLAQIVI
jgi:hypothetical protein